MRKVLIICTFFIMIPEIVYCHNIADTVNELGVFESFESYSEIFPEFDYNTLISDLEKGQGFDIADIIRKIAEYFIKELISHYKVFISIVITGFAVSVVNTVRSEDKAIYDTSFLIFYAVYASMIVYCFTKCIQPAKQMLEMLFNMIKVSLPLLVSLLTASGAVTLSSLVSSSLMAMVEVLAYVINLIVLPLIVSSVTISVANNMSDKINIGAMMNLMRQAAKWILGFCLAVYTGFYSVYGVVGASLDSRIGKAARFALGRGIPVVGGVVSESIETVMSVMGAVRNLTGVAGITCICIIALVPLIKTLVYMLTFKLASVVLEPIADQRIIALTTETADGISLIMSVLIASCLLFVGCIGILMIAGNFLL